MDNIFVIVMIFSYFLIPDAYQHRVLFWGILGALLLRGMFIAVGALLIKQFSWIMYVFGAFLIFTGVKMAVRQAKEFDVSQNLVMRTARRFLRVVSECHGQRFFTIQRGRRFATPLFLALLMVEFTDLVFAADSIPSIFAVTTDTFIVYTSNVFAILGLRSMYFLLAGIVHQFAYLRYGLASILTFVGIKMVVIDIRTQSDLKSRFEFHRSNASAIRRRISEGHRPRGAHPGGSERSGEPGRLGFSRYAFRHQ